jgi:hypothetical protein
MHEINKNFSHNKARVYGVRPYKARHDFRMTPLSNPLSFPLASACGHKQTGTFTDLTVRGWLATGPKRPLGTASVPCMQTHEVLGCQHGLHAWETQSAWVWVSSLFTLQVIAVATLHPPKSMPSPLDDGDAIRN